MKIIQETQNPLFKRKEIQASIEAEVTPSNVDVGKLLAEKFSSQPEAIAIKNIIGKFGSKEFIVTAKVYDSREAKENVEPKSKKDVKAETEQPAEEKK